MKWYYHVLVFIWKYCHKFEYLKLQGPIKIFLHGIFMNFFYLFMDLMEEGRGWGGRRKERRKKGEFEKG